MCLDDSSRDVYFLIGGPVYDVLRPKCNFCPIGWQRYDIDDVIVTLNNNDRTDHTILIHQEKEL